MAAPFLDQLLGFRLKANRDTGELVRTDKPNIADTGGNSLVLAQHILESLRIDQDAPFEGQSAGAELERHVQRYLSHHLPSVAPDRTWEVRQDSNGLSSFAQYRNLQRIAELFESTTDGRELALSIGLDYEVEPDVTVGLVVDQHEEPLLHASVSCKLTLRSDRAQNARLEAATMIRNRQGRVPHIVVVTAEPLPSRLLSLTRGLGDIDAVYHVALDELVEGVELLSNSGKGNLKQKKAMHEMLSQERLLKFDRLLPDLAM